MCENSWPKIAVMGAGAVGCYFGGILARAGAPVVLIGRARHADAIQRDGLVFDGMDFQETIRVSASTEARAASDAAIVLLCVKTFDTEPAARALAPHLAPDAALISLQNGVDNVERIRSAAGVRAIAGVVYVAAAMTAPGRVEHNGRGDLIIGHLSGGREAPLVALDCLRDVASLFDRAGIPCRVSEHIERELWTKMIINCAYNAVSALGHAQYRRLRSNPWSRQIIIQTIKEAASVARAAGVPLDDRELIEAGLEIAKTMASATSSTAQDLVRGARTEIDSLNGYITQRGAELGVRTPINQTLHALVKLLEESDTKI